MNTQRHSWLLALLLMLGFAHPQTSVKAADPGPIFLPFIGRNAWFGADDLPAVNAPYFTEADIIQSRFGEMAVFWFGQITTDRASTDVRIGWNNQELVVYTATYDRIISYNPHSDGSDLTQWDTAALAIQTSAGDAVSPGADSYRFLSEVRWFEPGDDPRYQRTMVGTGHDWQVRPIRFINNFGYMGTVPGDEKEDKGWSITFRIPFSSLGLAGAPAPGTRWRMQLEVFNRNSQAGPPLGSEVWPLRSTASAPASWGYLNFGIPSYTPPPAKNPGAITLTKNTPGIRINDVSVGGGANCGAQADPLFFERWGSLNYAGEPSFNIQNQGLIADWNCFSRYIFSSTLPSLPPGKIFRSARLVLTQMGGSEPSQARPSWIQVLTLNQNWAENTLTWNTLPQAHENIGGAWVGVVNPDWSSPDVWNTLPRREWDVSRAVLEALQEGQPLRLALYSADDGGKRHAHGQVLRLQ